MLLIKKVLGNTSTPEKHLAMQDYCTIMHRLDRMHSTHYPVIRGVIGGKDEQTIQEYLTSEKGQIWQEAERIEEAQHYIKFVALTRFASLRNRTKLRETYLQDTVEKRECYAWMRHALTRINCFQVRIFVALLFNMCTVEDILNAGENADTVVKDEVVEGAWAKPFKMQLYCYDAGNLHVPVATKEAWCYPMFAPPSAMQCIMSELKLSSTQCAWTNHIKAGLHSLEEGMALKLSWFKFYRENERWTPLEQLATKKDALAAQKRWAELQKYTEEISAEYAAQCEEMKEADGAANEADGAANEAVGKVREAVVRQRRCGKGGGRCGKGDGRGGGAVTKAVGVAKEAVRAAIGKPMFSEDNTHQWAAMNRLNTQLEYNGGYQVGIPKRYGNLGVESINRNTNRYTLNFQRFCLIFDYV